MVKVRLGTTKKQRKLFTLLRTMDTSSDICCIYIIVILTINNINIHVFFLLINTVEINKNVLVDKKVNAHAHYYSISQWLHS